MPDTRYLITVLVAAQLVGFGIGELSGRIQTGFVTPLLRLVVGAPDIPLMFGRFDVGGIIGAFISCLFTIFFGLLLLRLVLVISWRWIFPMLPTAAPEKRS